VGELSPSDPSLQINGLRPDHGYVVRITAINSSNFSSTSIPLFIQTKPETSGDYFAAPTHHSDSSLDDPLTGVSVRPYKALLDTLVSSSSAIPMQREHSGSVSQQQKRNASARRQTQTALAAPDPLTEPFPDLPESEDTIKDLTDKLDKLRTETEQFDTQMSLDELKFREDHDTLIKSLQEVQQQLQDKNNATRKLNQHVATLVTEESMARKDKAAVDKLLEKATQERQRIDDDMTRWQTEASEIEERINRLSQEQETYEKDAKKKVAELKETFAGEKAKNDTMEEGIKSTIARIKELEEETKRLEEDENEVGNGAILSTTEEEETWRKRILDLQQRYANLAHQHHQIKNALIHDQGVLDMWRQYYASQTQAYQAPQIEVPPHRRNSGRQGDSGLHIERRVSLSGFDHGSASGFGISPSFQSVTPFLNITNGMTLPSDSMAMSPTETDLMMSGVPTSPSAINTLLPSDLLGDEIESRFGAIGERSRMNRDSPTNPNVLPGLGAPETLDYPNQGPSSPISVQSRSPSVFTSPRVSNTNLPHMSGSGTFGDTDRKSVRSNTGSARAVSGGVSGTKFASLFHLGRQRTKGSSDEGPMLGSLRSNESQSMPRPDGEEDIPEGSTSSRRRGSHSGPSWMGQMLGRANTSVSMEDSRKKRFTMFGGAKKNDPWGDGKDSPRPGSTASSDTHGLPRPSAETVSRFGWPVSGGDFAPSQLGNPLNADWRLGSSSGWATRLHSRNSSMQYGHMLDGTFDTPDMPIGPTQAPIGTRPRSPPGSDSRPQTSTPLRLNPNAPAFSVAFSARSSEKKSEKSSKSKDKSKTNGQIKSARSSIKDQYDVISEDGRSSPFDPRRSRDGNSILSVDYASDSATHESLDRSQSSAAPSESGTAPKESFMRKLTRKSSAGFTSLAGRRGGAGSKKQSAAALAAAQAHDEATEGSQTTDDELAKSTATLGEDIKDKDREKERGAMSPLLGSGGSMRGFSLRSLRRRKGERNGSVDGDENEDAEVKS